MNVVYPIKDKSQIDKMKSYLKTKNFRNYIIFTLAINYGRRITDILEMRVGDIRNVTYINIGENKTGKHIPIRINENIHDEIIAYCEFMADDCYLFPSKKINKNYVPDSSGHTPIGRIQIWQELSEAAVAVGIKENIGTHSLRKTFGYHLYKSTNDIALVQRVFMHRSPLDTLRYIGLEQEAIDNATMALEL